MKNPILANSKDALIIAPFRATLIIAFLAICIAGIFILYLYFTGKSPSRLKDIVGTIYILTIILVITMSLGLIIAYSTAMLFFWLQHKLLEARQLQTPNAYILIGLTSGIFALFSIYLLSLLYQGSLSTGVKNEIMNIFVLGLFIIPASLIAGHQFHKIASQPQTKPETHKK